MKISPAKNVVVTVQPENKTSTGLLLAKDEKDDKAPELGLVVEIGGGKPPVQGLKVGALIVFRKYTDNRIPVHGKEYNFISYKDVLAVVEE